MLNLELQEPSRKVYESKYALKTHAGELVDKSVDETFKRVALALANVEKEEVRSYWYPRFLFAMENGAIPAGRIMSNAGAEQYKPNTSTINCVTSGILGDSISGILQGVKEAGQSLAAGCGIGYDFTTLRPKGAYVGGVGASTTGALGFMNIFDSMCFTIASAGGRRGAQMGAMDICHPDVPDFIRAKREDGRFRQFNLSLLITDEFMECLEKKGEWSFYFPVNRRESLDNIETFYRKWPSLEDYMIRNSSGEVLCRVYSKMPAEEVWDLIMRSTFDYAEPGFIMIDAVNTYNNNYWCENIRTTNPCAEQPLPPYGSCLLGSVLLTKFVRNPFTPEAYFDYDKYREVVRVFTRMLDNVVEINGLPLPSQRKELEDKRRHGMGYLGLGSTLAMLGMAYGTDEAVNFTYFVSKILAIEGWKVAAELSQEKGEAPVLQKSYDSEAFFGEGKLVESTADSAISGRTLFLESAYMARVFLAEPELRNIIEKHGVRFTHHSSIAPTGTISFSFGNNCSNGIEPTFAHEYFRNVIKEGEATKSKERVVSYEQLVWEHLNPGQPLPEYCKTTETVTPQQHVAMQAAAQYWVDSAISKTINVPTDIDFKDFKDIYLDAYKQGLKGCTTFRFNPSAFQGVLVKEEDLKATTYVFVLEDGTEVELNGNDQVMYDGKTHGVANLFDAIKEGTYGKY